jgi:hypothetical protein
MKRSQFSRRRLKRLVANLTLDKHMLAEALRKKIWGPYSVWNWPCGCTAPLGPVACGLGLAQFSRTAWYRRSQGRDQSTLGRRLHSVRMERINTSFLKPSDGMGVARCGERGSFVISERVGSGYP